MGRPIIPFCCPENLYYLAAQSATNARIPGSHPVERTFVGAGSLSFVLLILALAALVVRSLASHHSEKGYLYSKRDNGYWSVNTHLLGAVVLAIYGMMAVASCFVVRTHLTSGASLGPFLYLVTSLPAPLFLWAWFHAGGTAYRYHKAAAHSERVEAQTCTRCLLPPRALNSCFVAFPVVVVLLTTVVLALLMSRAGEQLKQELITLYRAHPSDMSPALWQPAIPSCNRATILYQSLWAVWATAFLIVSFVIFLYSTLLHISLRRRVEFLDVQQSNPVPTPSGSNLRETRIAHKKERARQEEAAKALRSLKRDVQLSRIEAIALGLVYSIPWAGIALFKAAMGYSTFERVDVWGGVLATEICYAALCASFSLLISIWRGINIYRTQLRVRRRKARTISAAGGAGTSIQITVTRDCHFESYDGKDDIAGSPLSEAAFSMRPPLSATRVKFDSLSEYDGEEGFFKVNVEAANGKGGSEDVAPSPTSWTAPQDWSYAEPLPLQSHFPIRTPMPAARSPTTTRSPLGRRMSSADKFSLNSIL